MHQTHKRALSFASSTGRQVQLPTLSCTIRLADCCFPSPHFAAIASSSPSSNFPVKEKRLSSPSETEHNLNQHNLTILAADVISVRDAGSGFWFGTVRS